MRGFVFVLMLVASATAANAADIAVFAPGIASVGLRKLADAWTARTGNKVIITGANVGRILASVHNSVPADLVVLPRENVKEVVPRLKAGTTVSIGRVLFGMAAKAGAPRPEISTLDKFAPC